MWEDWPLVGWANLAKLVSKSSWKHDQNNSHIQYVRDSQYRLSLVRKSDGDYVGLLGR